jgi:hypothetical protein
VGIKYKTTTIEPDLTNNKNTNNNITIKNITVVNKNIATESTPVKKKYIYNYKSKYLKALLIKRAEKYSIIIITFEDEGTININV